MNLPFILYDNLFALGVPIATDTDAGEGFDVAHIVDWRPYTRWKAAGVGTKYLTVDAGAALPGDALGVSGHNLGTIGATVSLETSATGVWGGEEAERVPGFVPADDGPILKTYTSVSDRYLRLKIVGGSAAAEVGVLCVGAKTEIPEYPDSPLDWFDEGSKAQIAVSKGGHLLGTSSRYRDYRFGFEFTYFPLSFIDGDFRTFWEAHGANLIPFFVGFKGAARFCRLPDNFRLSERLADDAYVESFSLPFEGVAS